ARPLETRLETSLELACHSRCPLRRFPLRNHLAEERERRCEELAAGLRHARAAREPLSLLLLPLLLRLVHRAVRSRAEQHFEALLQLLHARCETARRGGRDG